MALSSVFGMFAQSPIRPIQKHMGKALECAKELLPFLDALLQGNWEQAAKHQKNISDIEREADILKKDLRLHLPKGVFLPVPRTDILELLTIQDEVANKAEDISGIMLGRRMSIPTSLVEPFKRLLIRTVDATEQANTAINELDELLETGFRGREAELVEEMIHQLDNIESETDRLQIDVRYALFQIEKELPAVDVIFLYNIIEHVGALADQAQQVGERLLLLLAH